MLAKSLNHIVRIRPPARRVQGDIDLDQYDDDRLISSVDGEKKVIELHNLRCDHRPLLGFDHIHSYVSDPVSDVGDETHAFLQLHIQVFLTDRGPKIEPLPPGYWNHDGIELPSPYRPPEAIRVVTLLMGEIERNRTRTGRMTGVLDRQRLDEAIVLFDKHEPESSLTKLLHELRDRTIAQGVLAQYGTPTVAPQHRQSYVPAADRASEALTTFINQFQARTASQAV